MSEERPGSVRNRLVVHIHGYQATPPERFHRRFVRDCATFGRTWSVAAEAGPAEIRPRQARWQAHAAGPDWRTRTDYRIVRLDDLIVQGHAEPILKRVGLGLRGLLDFLFDRAILRYFRYGWRYALFTLAPLVMIAGAGLAGLAAGWVVAPYVGATVGTLMGVCVAAGAIWRLSRPPWLLFVLLEDWAFASVLARRLVPELDARIGEAASEIRAAVDGGTYDEVLLIGHSLGAAMILHLSARLLGDLPAEPPPRTPIAILTIGSSVLKIALHSAAETLRRDTGIVTASPHAVWAEYWSPQDVMNFPRTDPAAAMGVQARFPPIFRKAVFRQMVDAETFRRLRFDFFRKHNLFFHAPTRRSVYDYFLFVCGPFRASDLFREREGAMGWIDEAGGLTASAPGRAARPGAVLAPRQRSA